MCWALVIASILLAGPSFPLSKGAFVGGFFLDGQVLQITAPTGERWVSEEQVQREILFRGWKTPLTTEQMAELAEALDADFSVDILMMLGKTKRKWQALVVMRVVSARLREIVYLVQEQVRISDPAELPQISEQICSSALTKLPTQLPLATVQLREGERRLHLVAGGGIWRKGTNVVVFRDSSGQITVLGKGRISSANLMAGGDRWLLEVELTKLDAPVRSSDKIVQVFALPKPFAKLQK
ncbi:MAG: hypothetical protein ACUVTP_04450 [Candidatus Fervidibacter sp.]|uniref:hypothetical protein n=1 Tax=Candidatus Fervidibacter sp. TaxID=3100871 RepID=UPI00404B8D2D